MKYLPNMHKSRSRDMRTRNNEQLRRGLCRRNVKRETEPLNVNIKDCVQTTKTEFLLNMHKSRSRDKSTTNTGIMNDQG